MRKWSWLRRVLTGIGLLWSSVGWVAPNLPELGDVSEQTLSPQQAQVLGENMMIEIRRDISFVDDVELEQYLQQLGQRLAAASPDNRQRFTWFVIDDVSVNAFALPAGFIGVHTGLFTAARSESELAAVLAHEIAHVTQHHLARIVAQQERNSLATLGAIALGILAARSNPDVANAAIVSAQAGMVQKQLDYTREHEHEADRIGLNILTQAGFDPRAMVDFFTQLQRATRLYDDGSIPAYLRTHPLTTERLADAENRAAQFPYRQIADSLDFQLLRARLKVQQQDARDSVAYWQSILREQRYREEVVARYALVLAQLRANQPALAQAELLRLQALKKNHPMLTHLQWQVWQATAQTTLVRQQCSNTVAQWPAAAALRYDCARTQLQAGQAREALALLDAGGDFVSQDWRQARLRAEAFARLGQRSASHAAQAESYLRQGKLEDAIDQLERAQGTADGDFYTLSRVDARLRELKQRRDVIKQKTDKKRTGT